jgi:arabinogalactan endo-1,4-beta-galactosidase
MSPDHFQRAAVDADRAHQPRDTCPVAAGPNLIGRLMLTVVLAGGIGVASANQVTFQVNMEVQQTLGNFDPGDGDTMIVSGTFSSPDWTTTSTLSPAPADSNIYTGTFNNDDPAGQYGQYKFVINPGGNSGPSQLVWESGNNRWFQVASGNQTLPVVYFDGITNLPSPPTNRVVDFIAGADMSHLVFFEDRGIVYRTNGQPHDALETLQESGQNCVRLRIFTSNSAQAAADPYNYTNNLDYVLPLAVRVKNAGLDLLLDFHYSDTWADPGDQQKPAAWSGLNFTQLEQQIEIYSSNTIASLKAAGAMPDYVQIGNEIIGGMLWDDGRVGGGFDNPTQWDQLGRLMKAAINGVKGAAGDTPPLIMVHIDRGGDWGATQWFFDRLNAENVPYDIIGQSFYPWWHGDLSDLTACLNSAALKYGKPLVIAETAYPWTNSVWDDPPGLPIPASPEGQEEFVRELASILKNVPHGLGSGLIWWGSEYVELSGRGLAGFQRRSFFDYDGNELPVVDAVGSLASAVRLNAKRGGAHINLEWPLSGAGMSLMTTTSPAPAGEWFGTTNPVVGTGALFRVTVPIDTNTPQQVFRLESH